MRLPARRHAAQLTRMLETMAQLTHFTSLPFEQLLRLEAAQLPYRRHRHRRLGHRQRAHPLGPADLHDAGHPVSLIVVNDQPAPMGDLPLPTELPIYFVKQNWDELETIKLD